MRLDHSSQITYGGFNRPANNNRILMAGWASPTITMQVKSPLFDRFNSKAIYGETKVDSHLREFQIKIKELQS